MEKDEKIKWKPISEVLNPKKEEKEEYKWVSIKKKIEEEKPPVIIRIGGMEILNVTELSDSLKREAENQKFLSESEQFRIALEKAMPNIDALGKKNAETEARAEDT